MTWKGQITGCYVCVYLNTYDMPVHVITTQYKQGFVCTIL